MVFSEDLEREFGTANAYAILGLTGESSSITDAQIKRAYYKSSLKYHPDKTDDDSSTTKFQLLSQLYGILSDKDRREAYDSTGNYDDDVLDSDMDWYAFWRRQFKPVTTEDVAKFTREYIGSEEEKEDLKSLYDTFNGDMDKITECLMCFTYDQEGRIAKILQDLIDDGDLVAHEAFVKETKAKKAARRKRFEKEAKEANELAKELNVNVSSQTDLAKAIKEKNAERTNGFMQALEEKYASTAGKKKGKKAADSHTSDDEAKSDDGTSAAGKKTARKAKNTAPKEQNGDTTNGHVEPAAEALAVELSPPNPAKKPAKAKKDKVQSVVEETGESTHDIVPDEPIAKAKTGMDVKADKTTATRKKKAVDVQTESTNMDEEDLHPIPEPSKGGRGKVKKGAAVVEPKESTDTEEASHPEPELSKAVRGKAKKGAAVVELPKMETSLPEPAKVARGKGKKNAASVDPSVVELEDEETAQPPVPEPAKAFRGKGTGAVELTTKTEEEISHAAPSEPSKAARGKGKKGPIAEPPKLEEEPSHPPEPAKAARGKGKKAAALEVPPKEDDTDLSAREQTDDEAQKSSSASNKRGQRAAATKAKKNLAEPQSPVPGPRKVAKRGSPKVATTEEDSEDEEGTKDPVPQKKGRGQKPAAAKVEKGKAAKGATKSSAEHDLKAFEIAIDKKPTDKLLKEKQKDSKLNSDLDDEEDSAAAVETSKAKKGTKGPKTAAAPKRKAVDEDSEAATSKATTSKEKDVPEKKPTRAAGARRGK